MTSANRERIERAGYSHLTLTFTDSHQTCSGVDQQAAAANRTAKPTFGRSGVTGLLEASVSQPRGPSGGMATQALVA